MDADLLDAVIAVVAAAFGWFARWLREKLS